MKLVVYGIILCSVCFVYPAYGLTNAHSSDPKGAGCCASDSKRAATSVDLTAPPSTKAHGSQRLILDPPPEVRIHSSGSEETIKSLASGDSLVNPWLPGKGAIGVKVKVTW
jgi:hypothetical protein